MKEQPFKITKNYVVISHSGFLPVQMLFMLPSSTCKLLSPFSNSCATTFQIGGAIDSQVYLLKYGQFFLIDISLQMTPGPYTKKKSKFKHPRTKYDTI